ncbi:NAD(P)-binding protein [Fomitopsis serialis]|uniref:NAD(P)-binding protein n=1 Tax=Fomitopsis serialis TaxID=139415 RepID=UPI0020088092|nr:NAD(P)-binding protein [Neoantrodia serialis]KAH9930680.1 NAD(P)-binding protein [Neoantrodia serialis]
MSQPPTSTKVITVRKSPAGREPRYHDAALEQRAIPPLQKGEVLVKLGAAGFNHRDVWIRKGLYPGIAFGAAFGSDGAGTVVAAADANDALLNKRVFLVPMRGWESHPDAPESPKFTILGGGKIVPLGTFAEYVAVERDQVILTPDHLDDEHAAAWPLGGLTAWRASVVNARVDKGDNVLITGIGGGVALLAMQICLAHGANVYVSSSSEDKIRQAVSLGAKAGVNYKADEWPAQLEKLLKENSPRTPFLSAVIDSGGGDIMSNVSRILKPGGRLVIYGMTAAPMVTFTMREVLKNQQVIGSTMGSHKDLIDATKFMAEHRFVPIVSHVIDGLENAEQGFELISKGQQFGKVVIRIRHGDVGVVRASL